MGHFGDILPGQYLGLVLKKTKSNTTKTNNRETQWQKKEKQTKENLTYTYSQY